MSTLKKEIGYDMLSEHTLLCSEGQELRLIHAQILEIF